MAALSQKHVFKVLYRTESWGWSEDPAEADWYHWNGKPSGNLCADTKSESYWLIAGERYDDYETAQQAMYDELFIKPAVIPCLQIVFKELQRQERRKKKAMA